MRRFIIILAAWTVPAAICAGIAAARMGRSAMDGPPSPIIFPDQDLPLRFTHAAHLKRGAECLDCHAAAKTSRSSVDRLIPGEEDCRGCHAIDRSQPLKEVATGKGAARCDACHVGFDPKTPEVVRRVHIPTPNMKFDHSVHVARGVECRTCHGDFLAENTALATRDHLPRMRLCLQCHDGRQAASGCTTCHMAAPGGRVKMDYPEGMLAPSGVLRGDAHDLGFRTNHAAVARNDEKYCANCHLKSFCTECHDGAIKPMDFHANDYVRLHAIDARRNQPDCSACHREQSFCVGCHNRSGLGWQDPNRGSAYIAPYLDGDQETTFRFHPDGWINFPPSKGRMRAISNHSFQAQRNIKQCASCHREEFCKGCHATSGADQVQSCVNPHPANWRNSRRCEQLAAKAGRMCLRCHPGAGNTALVAEAMCDWELSPSPTDCGLDQ